MLSRRQADRLRRAGFIQTEIKRFNRDLDRRPAVVDFSAGPWASAIEARKAFMKQEKKKGRSLFSIRSEIEDFYRTIEGASPWDLIKVEYFPPARIARQQVQKLKKKRAERRLQQGLGRKYKRFGPVDVVTKSRAQ